MTGERYDAPNQEVVRGSPPAQADTPKTRPADTPPADSPKTPASSPKGRKAPPSASDAPPESEGDGEAA
jgi:hypothetical protein